MIPVLPRKLHPMGTLSMIPLMSTIQFTRLRKETTHEAQEKLTTSLNITTRRELSRRRIIPNLVPRLSILFPVEAVMMVIVTTTSTPITSMTNQQLKRASRILGFKEEITIPSIGLRFPNLIPRVETKHTSVMITWDVIPHYQLKLRMNMQLSQNQKRVIEMFLL